MVFLCRCAFSQTFPPSNIIHIGDFPSLSVALLCLETWNVCAVCHNVQVDSDPADKWEMEIHIISSSLAALMALGSVAYYEYLITKKAIGNWGNMISSERRPFTKFTTIWYNIIERVILFICPFTMWSSVDSVEWCSFNNVVTTRSEWLLQTLCQDLHWSVFTYSKTKGLCFIKYLLQGHQIKVPHIFHCKPLRSVLLIVSWRHANRSQIARSCR